MYDCERKTFIERENSLGRYGRRQKKETVTNQTFSGKFSILIRSIKEKTLKGRLASSQEHQMRVWLCLLDWNGLVKEKRDRDEYQILEFCAAVNLIRSALERAVFITLQMHKISGGNVVNTAYPHIRHMGAYLKDRRILE